MSCFSEKKRGSFSPSLETISSVFKLTMKALRHTCLFHSSDAITVIELYGTPRGRPCGLVFMVGKRNFLSLNLWVWFILLTMNEVHSIILLSIVSYSCPTVLDKKDQIRNYFNYANHWKTSNSIKRRWIK